MNRREFSKKLIAGAAAPRILANAERNPTSGADATLAPPTTPPNGFPPGSYTPHGYLDNPYHSWDLHPSGVLRSVPPLGMGLYYPAGPGGYFDYGKNSIYRSILRVGFRIGESLYYEDADFGDRGINLIASHHSKNIMTLAFEIQPVAISAAFFQVDEHTLACSVRLRNNSPSRVEVYAFAVQELEFGASNWWGRDGIVGSYHAEGDYALLRSFAAGPVFVLKADVASFARIVTPNGANLKSWMGGSPEHELSSTTYYPEPLSAGLCLKVNVSAAQTSGCNFFLSREMNQASAAMEAGSAHSSAASVFLTKTAEDDHFWSRAPRLEGDFPEHWKNSWVYDFETLRTMVRRPLGVYKHPWDAMQIQAPRNVLAETSIDMWTLSYADAEIAKSILLAQFEDAVAPNVPCMREDAIMNMVAADGSECGTSLQWCYPFYCIESVFLRTGDRAWLGKLYPFLAAHLDWTLKNRTDGEGWIVPKCSWESGMDGSGRFLLKQPTGGELIDFVRVAELQAAMSHASHTLERYARLLGMSGDISRWAQLASTYVGKTRQLWYKGWFYDVDSRSGKPIVIPGRREVTQVGPVMCEVATADQVRTMVPAMLEYGTNQGFWLEWPSHVLPFSESMWRAGERTALSQMLYAIIDRVYSSMDRREVQPEKKLGWPGVSCEVWALEGARGGECYGWGATLPAHIIRSIFGFREDHELDRLRFSLGPNIPDALWAEGKSFWLRNIHYRNQTFNLHYQCGHGQKLLVNLTLSSETRSHGFRINDEKGQEVPSRSSKSDFFFEAVNHALYHVQ